MGTNLSQQKREKLLNNIKIMREKLQNNPELLKSLADIESELKRKKYGLIWEEHEERVDEELKTKIPVFVEDKGSEIRTDKDKPINFLIEGDNLHSLYLLEKTHKGRIDLIIIDPPYNTGKKDFIYNDDYINYEDGFKHSKWLSFMKKRLEIAEKLLSSVGIIFLHIDEFEFAQLKLLCDEIFGEENFIENFIWIKNSTKNNSNTTSTNHEYILCYAKNINYMREFSENFRIKKLGYFETLNFVETEKNKGKKPNEIEKNLRTFLREHKEWKGIQQYKNIDNQYRVFRISDSSAPGGNGHNYDVLHPLTKKKCIVPSRGWAYSPSTMEEHLKNNRIYFGKDEKCVPQYKRFLTDVETEVLKSIIEDNNDGKKEIMRIFDNKKAVFNNPKPISLEKLLIQSINNKNFIVLDFFAGSGTTGQAVLEINKEDDGNRQFILCTNNESNICRDITYKRIQKVIQGYGDAEGISTNLKYYKTEYIDKFNHKDDQYYIINELSKHIRELVQLERGIDTSDKSVQILFTDEEIDRFYKDLKAVKTCKTSYVDTNALITDEQMDLFTDNDIQICYIPEYYFEDEILEVEQW